MVESASLVLVPPARELRCDDDVLASDPGPPNRLADAPSFSYRTAESSSRYPHSSASVIAAAPASPQSEDVPKPIAGSGVPSLVSIVGIVVGTMQPSAGSVGGAIQQPDDRPCSQTHTRSSDVGDFATRCLRSGSRDLAWARRAAGNGARVIQPLVGWLRGVRPRRSDVVGRRGGRHPRCDQLGAGRHGHGGAGRASIPPTACTRRSPARSAAALSTSTSLMVVTTTTAASLAAGLGAGRACRRTPGTASIVLLTMLTGVGDHRRRRAAPRPVRPVRLPLGDARLPHRRRGEHPARASCPT